MSDVVVSEIEKALKKHPKNEVFETSYQEYLQRIENLQKFGFFLPKNNLMSVEKRHSFVSSNKKDN